MPTSSIPHNASQLVDRFWRGLQTFAADIARGFINVSHHSFALLGLLAVLLALLALAKPEVRTLTIQNVQGWLFTRLNISETEDAKQQVLLRSLAAQSSELNPNQLALVQAIGISYDRRPRRDL